MNNLNRLVILVVLIGLLYLLYVFQEQSISAEETKQKDKQNEEEEAQLSESSLSLTLHSSDLTMGTSGSNMLDSTYDSDVSDDEEEEDGLNFQVAE